MRAHIIEGDTVRVSTDPADITKALTDKQPIWVELETKDEHCDRLLGEVLKLHPLTIEDIWATRSTPKLEDYDTYLYVIIHGVRGAQANALELVELDIVIGQTFVITHDPNHLVDEVAGELERSPRLLSRGPAWLAHAILDHAVDRYLPVIDDLDGEIEDLENNVLRYAGTKLGPPILRKILGFKRMLLQLRRVSIHQREILLRLARGEFDEIPKEATPFFRDIYDHFLRVNDLVESYRDLVTSALEAYLSVQSNRMNDIMKTLTLISTVMLPITFIAGVFGMNFENMPTTHTPWGFWASLALMAVITAGSLWWFRTRGWIGAKGLSAPDPDEDADEDDGTPEAGTPAKP